MSVDHSPVRASCGVQVAPTSGLIEPSQLHYIAVIGGLLYRGPWIDRRVRSYLLNGAGKGTNLIGICTGSFVLCRLGLMRGKTCSVSWFHYRDFIEEFKDVVPAAELLYHVDHDRITSAGGIGAALAAAHVIERHLDGSASRKALHIMQIDRGALAVELQPAPTVGSSYIGDPRVRRALLIMEQTISRPLSKEQLASRLQISRRTLERLFERYLGFSPHTAYLNLRLTYARAMLKSHRSLEHISKESGFDRSSHFCQAYKRTFGHTPSEDRGRLRKTVQVDGSYARDLGGSTSIREFGLVFNRTLVEDDIHRY
jgi:transcriptional regulator GlxA family with amidase domain